MWTKQPLAEVPGSSPSQGSGLPGARLSATATMRPIIPTARDLACLGSTLKVKGEIFSDEDLQIDGTVEGPISVQGHRLIVGRTAQLSSEVTAREVIVYGNVTGNLRARDRVEIKKDGELIGDISTAQIRIEDGAYFKGRIEIERANSPVQRDQETVDVPAIGGADEETVVVR